MQIYEISMTEKHNQQKGCARIPKIFYSEFEARKVTNDTRLTNVILSAGKFCSHIKRVPRVSTVSTVTWFSTFFRERKREHLP